MSGTLPSQSIAEQLAIPPIASGYSRSWCKCYYCEAVGYRDYVPGGPATLAFVTPHQCRLKVDISIGEDEALALAMEQREKRGVT